MIEWYFVFLAFIPQHTTIDTVGPFATKQQCETQQKATIDMISKRLRLSGQRHTDENIRKEVRAWDCYPVPDPKKKKK